MSELLCIGLTTLDIVARPIDALPSGEATRLIEGIEIIPAGTAAGAALVAAVLGVDTMLSGAIGDDRKGRLVRATLQQYGVDTTLLRTLPGPTSTTILPIDNEGRRPALHAPGAAFHASIGEEDIAVARMARFVHWGGIGGPKLDGGPGADLLQAAKAAGATVTCDLISPGRAALTELALLLPHVDYFMPSATEAISLSGRSDLDEAADFFVGQGAGACIIKNGGAGARALIGGAFLSVPAHDIRPLDTTSCGDSFCAGFIAALGRGWAPPDALRFAAATAACVAQGLGTLGILQSFEVTERAMREMPIRTTT